MEMEIRLESDVATQPRKRNWDVVAMVGSSSGAIAVAVLAQYVPEVCLAMAFAVLFVAMVVAYARKMWTAALMLCLAVHAYALGVMLYLLVPAVYIWIRAS
ncbi:MAG TPA: hypothetical protein VF572_06920 [Candidatus Saccharimonadales bacterium]|jgi:hypothetical protein